MSNEPSSNQRVPSSPDSLQTGIRGRIVGVTRIGPRALGIGALALFVIVALIFVGANKQQVKRSADSGQAAFSAPAPTDTGHFGDDEPIAASYATAPVTPARAGGNSGPPVPPGLVLKTPAPAPPADNGATTVPNIETATAPAPAAAPPGAGMPSRSDVLAAQKAQRAAAAEQARAQAEAVRIAQLQAAHDAPILIGGSAASAAASASTGAAASAVPPTGDATPAPGASANANAFLSGPFGQYASHNGRPVAGGTANAADYLDAQRYAPRGRYEIVASSVIPAELITGIDSEQPGLISAAVRQDVFDSQTGRFLLIPKGSRLVGVYKSDTQTGQTRVLVAWERLIFPDTSSIDLHEQSGADVEGYAGLSGSVDNHIASAFGAVALSSVISAGLQLSQPKLNMTNAGIPVPSTGQILAGAIGQQASEVSSQIVQKQLSVPPTIHVPRGYPFVVIVDRDMVLPGPYFGSGS